MTVDKTRIHPLDELRTIMARLRDPQNGCPWDLKQTFQTIAPYTIEEAYEVADAIDQQDFNGLKDELGDLLLQVVFHARMAEEKDIFTLSDVINSISSKMIERHPHIFSDSNVSHEDEVRTIWEEKKKQERSRKASANNQTARVLDGVSPNLPALIHAQKLQERTARVGFDWVEADDIIEKITEEMAEVSDAARTGNAANIAEEIGDLLFACVNLARHYRVDAETALRQANRKFIRRFNSIEDKLKARNQPIETADLALLDELWEEAKTSETD